jgi:spore germination protein
MPSHDYPITIFASVQKNIQNIKTILHNPVDLSARVFTIGQTNHTCAVICIDGLVDKKLVNDEIIKNIQLGTSQANLRIPHSTQEIIEELANEILSIYELNKSNQLDDVMFAILSGDTALFIEGSEEVLLIGSKGWETRGIEEPLTEALVRGPRDGFNENLQTNMVHIRRRIRDPNLRFDSLIVGRRSKVGVVITYIDGVVHPQLVTEIKRRISSIDLDNVQESGFIEQWIEDSFLSPFPQIQHTERPDKVTAAISQGRVGILVDGTPFALLAPVTLGQFLQSQEDYYDRWQIGTAIRIMRYFAAFIATFLPSLYIALLEYQQGMIPSKLAFSIAGTREGVPFPAVIEAVMMEATLELLREAGIRMPKPIGQTIGIVGGLVIGEAAVSAGIVSPVMVIIVAITAISSFAMPSYSFGISLRLLRFGIMASAAVFGLYGVILSYVMINIHIANLKSFGIPYSTPFSPTLYHDWRDLVIRAPLMFLRKRPQMLQTDDPMRMNKKGGKS